MASLALRLLWISVVPAEPVSDFHWYYERAMGLAAGRGYSVNGTPTAFWPVGYPAFLALQIRAFGASLLSAKLSNVFLYLGILWLSYVLARMIFCSEFCGRTTLAILAFYPNHIAYSSLVSSEILFLFLILLSTFLFLKAAKSLALAPLAGFALGLATLVKTQGLFLAPVLVFSQLWRPDRPARLRRLLVIFALVCCALAATVLPWVARNYWVFGGIVLSNNDGLNLLYGNNPYATGTYDPGFQVWLEPLLGYASEEYERNAIARRVAIDYILQHPLKTLGLWPKKLFYLYNEDGEGFMWNEKGIRSPGSGVERLFGPLICLDQGYYLFLLAGSIIAIPVLLCRRARLARFPLTPLLVVAYLTLVSLLTIAHSRLHFPLVPWMAMYAAALLKLVVLR